MNKKILFTLLLFLFSIGATAQTRFWGNAVSYEYISTNRYKVLFHHYQFCSPSSPSAPATVKLILKGDKNCFKDIPITATRDTVINQTFWCKAGGSCATSPTATSGIEEYIYSAIVDLDSSTYKEILDSNCCDVYFEWTNCCRNVNISTGSGGNSATNYAYLNRCIAPTNSSVKYKNKSVIAAITNKTFEYNPGAIDADGDSLVFSLEAPLSTSRTSFIAYNSPLSAKIPFTPICPTLAVNCAPSLLSGIYVGFGFDSVTNNIRMTPKTAGESSVFVNKTEEYRKDTGGVWRLIGITRKDQQINVNNQSSKTNLPQISNIPAQYACVGNPFVLNVATSEKAPSTGLSDSTYLSWINPISGSTMKMDDSSAKHQSATFTWTPTSSQASLQAYLLHVNAIESNCDDNGQVSKAIPIYVVDSLTVTKKLTDKGNGTLVFEAIINGGSPLLPNTITWNIDTNKNFSTSKNFFKVKDSIKRLDPGKYYVNLIIENGSNCIQFISDSIIIAPYFRFNFRNHPTTFCNKNEIQITPTVLDAKRPISYEWFIEGSSTTISTDSILTAVLQGTTTYLLNANDANNINYFESITITAIDLPNLSSVKNPAVKCVNDGQFDLLARFPLGTDLDSSTINANTIEFKNIDSRRQNMVINSTSPPYWYYSDRFYNTNINGFVPNPPVDSIRIYAVDKNTGCIDSTGFTVRVNKNPVISLNTIEICQNKLAFNVNDLLVNSPSNPNNGKYTWTLDSIPFGINPALKNKLLEDRDPSAGDEYWFNLYLPDRPTADPTNKNIPGKYKLTFCFTNNNNCETCDSVYLTVKPSPEVSFKPVPDLCANDPQLMLDSYVNLQGGRWVLKAFNSLDSGTEFNLALARVVDSTKLNINNAEGGTYKFDYINEKFECAAKDSLIIVIKAIPILKLNKNKDSLYLGETLFLEVVQGDQLSLLWENGTIDKKRQIRELSTPEGVNKFIIKGTDLNTKCNNSDTATITVFKTKRPTGLTNILAKSLKVYPNPVNDILHIQSGIRLTKATLFDALGKAIFVSNNINDFESNMDLEHVAAGLYILEISSENETTFLRVQVSK